MNSNCQINVEHETENEQISLLKIVNELYKHNKLTKVNAWNYEYINSFQSLVRNHHHYLSNFQNVCPSMDTMVKIFKLRVDSVSMDILRIVNRVSCSPYDSINELNETVQSHVDVHEEMPMQRNKRNRLRKKRLNKNFRANIATKAQLNAPLQMLSSIPNPIISKIHKIDGEEGKPNRMLSNLLPTAGKSNLSVCGNQQFFDASPAERIKLKKNNDYNVPEDNFIELPIKIYRQFMLIRPTECGNETLDNNEYCESIAPSLADQPDNFIFDFDGMEQGEFYDDATPDTNGLFESNDDVNEPNYENEADAEMNNDSSEPPNVIQRSHPPLEDLSKGDYSYFKGIENFLLGPSYWRFKNTRKRPNPNNNEPAPKSAKSRRKKIHEMPSFTTSDDSSDEEFTTTRKVREVNLWRWNSQNNRLPMYRSDGIKQIPKDFFDFYEFAPTLRTWKDTARGNDSMNDIKLSLNSTEDEAQILNDVPPFASSPDTSRFNEMPAFDIDVDEQLNVESLEWEVQGDISELYTGVPPAVEQINIRFNKLPKQINMKRINTATLASIKKQFERSIELPVNVRTDEEFEKGYATFANTHGSLVKRFKDIAFPSISLLSLLHNTNDHRFKLDRKPNENANNFKIQQLKKLRSRPSFDVNELIVHVERNR